MADALILPDTSVWVKSRYADQPAITAHLKTLLASRMVLGHEVVSLELILGHGSETRAKLIELYSRLPMVETVPTKDLFGFLRKHSLSHKGVGVADVMILASTMAAGAKLWAADSSLQEVAKALGCAYESAPPAKKN